MQYAYPPNDCNNFVSETYVSCCFASQSSCTPLFLRKTFDIYDIIYANLCPKFPPLPNTLANVFAPHSLALPTARNLTFPDHFGYLAACCNFRWEFSMAWVGSHETNACLSSFNSNINLVTQRKSHPVLLNHTAHRILHHSKISPNPPGGHLLWGPVPWPDSSCQAWRSC